ncbi:hypothetical protein D3C87_358570 [compost metagenome]
MAWARGCLRAVRSAREETAYARQGMPGAEDGTMRTRKAVERLTTPAVPDVGERGAGFDAPSLSV